MGNTVGSSRANFCNFCCSKEDSYILGIWCADGYWWSSSIGLSNTDQDLLRRFRKFLSQHFIDSRIKYNRNHLFVNSRPLLREFVRAKDNLLSLQDTVIIEPYLAGRFDGDGSVSKDFRSDCRIVYGNQREAEVDKLLMSKVGITRVKIYYYASAHTFCLYVSRFEAGLFLKHIFNYSSKLQKLARVTP
jgi:hypothetical protein